MHWAGYHRKTIKLLWQPPPINCLLAYVRMKRLGKAVYWSRRAMRYNTYKNRLRVCGVALGVRWAIFIGIFAAIPAAWGCFGAWASIIFLY